MSEASESIEQGLKEALAHARGAVASAASETLVHEIEVPEPDARAIRARTGLSQAAFAHSIGIAKGTLLQ